ncbi:MAG: hypothetical protein A3D35_01230 [Candidatus Staskawiczbacteria bacterium RIFCSPHIGHO2_02_FULL_34_9]|uniref:GH26 domain-containing protein n=1 Tax=Candidatus Staskawiczbacteria bacterium RIFCSPHIGHO2_02_FULL_34_9 TaxID=1802206 RepID=A0A1G2I3I9_9BACT|nr:MAG: hypothetical protein A3D35_01230 [Candidatus Staskawiczbacteria bacterium RIFCSPHIGHO2_02_FULL_34_9]
METKKQYIIFFGAMVILSISLIYATIQNNSNSSKLSNSQPTEDNKNTIVEGQPENKPEDKVITSIVWGAYTGNTIDSIKEFEEVIGKKPSLYAIFINFKEPFPYQTANYLKYNNQTILIYLEQSGVTVDDIIAGKHDSYINELASDIKNYEGQVMLAPLHEMNGNWDPWGGTVGKNTPSKLIAEWRHLRDVFDKNEVKNVKWVFNVNNESVPDKPENDISAYYPGDNYVDIVGVDGFNFSNKWQSYDEMFSKSIEKLSVYNKPIYILSFASAEGPKKADWMKDSFSKIYSDQRIKGWIWFNEKKEENWLVWSSQDSLKVFKEQVLNY